MWRPEARAALALLLAVLAGCFDAGDSEVSAPKVTPTIPAPAPEIAWYPHGVDEALSESADSGKPVFLFWGAKWCPPCNQLKATVFRRPVFVEKTRRFVPVYLDGDTAGAQRWGEHFGILGYPTLLVLRGDRTEIARLSSGLDLEQYPRTLDLALEATRPVSELVEIASRSPDRLAAADWERLAMHGWAVDLGRTVAEDQLALTLQVLADASPDARWRRRFEWLALTHKAGAAQDPASALTPPERKRAAALLDDLLRDPAARADNLIELQYDGAALLFAAVRAPEARANWVGRLREVMVATWSDSSLSPRQRLQSAYTLLGLHELGHPDAPLSPEDARMLRDWARQAVQVSKTPFERQAVVLMAADVLEQSGHAAESEALLRQDLDTAVSPYYHLATLAEMTETRGDAVGALTLWREAWDRVEGPASRTQWGIYYVDALIRLKPADSEGIEQAATQLLEELGRHPDAYYQRTRRRLAGLGDRLEAWAGTHKVPGVLIRLQARLTPVCDALDPRDGLDTACREWVSPA